MKQGKALITFVMVLLAAALTCYLGYYVWAVSYTHLTLPTIRLV